MKLVLANLASPPLLARALLMMMKMVVMVMMIVLMMVVMVMMMAVITMMALITMMTIIKLVLPNLAPYSSLGQSSPEVFGLGASVMNRTMGRFFDANQRL